MRFLGYSRQVHGRGVVLELGVVPSRGRGFGCGRVLLARVGIGLEEQERRKNQRPSRLSRSDPR